LKRLIEAEQKALAEGKVDQIALKAVRDRFYKGDIAQEIVKFQAENAFKDDTGEAHTGNLTLDDFASYTAKIESHGVSLIRDTKFINRAMDTRACIFTAAEFIREF
jgi:gamma-glutamyltranspeptidase